MGFAGTVFKWCASYYRYLMHVLKYMKLLPIIYNTLGEISPAAIYIYIGMNENELE